MLTDVSKCEANLLLSRLQQQTRVATAVFVQYACTYIAYLITTMSMSSCLISPFGRPFTVKPWTRFTCESRAFLIWTFKLSVAVVLLRGVYKVPFKQTLLRLIDSSTAAGTFVTGFPLASVPWTSSNLHLMQACQQTPRQLLST